MIKYGDTEIRKLVERSQNGDRQAFGEVVKSMTSDIFALTYRMTQDRDAALDLTQETFISAWQKINSFRFEAKLSSWLYRIAYNKTLNYLESPAVARKGDESQLVDMPADSVSSPDSDLIGDDLKSRLRGFTASLPPMQRAVFDLRFYKQKSFAEIAQSIGRAEGTVKTNYRQAIIKLRKTAQAEGWKR